MRNLKALRLEIASSLARLYIDGHIGREQLEKHQSLQDLDEAYQLITLTNRNLCVTNH